MRSPAVYRENFSLLSILFIFAAASFEEIIFRQVILKLFVDQIGLHFLLAALFSSLFYALNHIYFGVNAVWQKLLTGLVYSLLFAASGYNILAPILTHAVQNVTLYAVSVNECKTRWEAKNV